MELMDFLSMLGEGIGNVVSGGATGVLGIGFGLVGKYFQDRQAQKKREFESAELDKAHRRSLETIKFEADNNLRIEEAKSEGAARVADIGALAESLKADKATYLTGWEDKVGGAVAGIIACGLALVDVTRGLTRPAITAYLAYTTAQMWQDSVALLSGKLAEAQQVTMAIAVVTTVSNQILFLTGVAIGWWFASRAQAHKQQQATA
jgi:hypothetical protein